MTRPVEIVQGAFADAVLPDGAAVANVAVAIPSAATAVRIKATPKPRRF